MNIIDNIFQRIRAVEINGLKVTGIIVSNDVLREIQAQLPLMLLEGFRLFDQPVAICNGSSIIAFEVE